MEDHPGVGASPNISSVLKPPRPRIPLKDLMSTAYDEDNTAVRKRRVSFANVNKIKEFSSGAESMVVCHTPAYEEPFSMSSDSSCPSGAEGWTPVKTNSTFNQDNEGAGALNDQKENILKSLPMMRMSGIYVPSDIAADNFTDGMEFTGCISHSNTKRSSTRYSMGMDLTSVVEQNMNYSAEGLDLTKTASLQPQTGISGSSFVHNESLNDSSALEFTEAINNPILSTIFSNTNVNHTNNTRYSVNGMDLTQAAPSKNPVYSVNNTRYSVNGMDMTQAAISRRSSVRMSTRYSTCGMDLTEAIDNNCSALEFTDVINEPKIALTRYSVNEMELTEAVQKDFITRSVYRTDDVTDRLDYSADCETSMDFTKPIHNIYQSTIDRSEMPGSCMEFTEVVGIGERRKSLNNTISNELYNNQETFGVNSSINNSELKPIHEDILLEKSATAVLKQETNTYSDEPVEELTPIQNPVDLNVQELSFVKDKAVIKPKTNISFMAPTTEMYNDTTSSVLEDKAVIKPKTNISFMAPTTEMYNDTTSSVLEDNNVKEVSKMLTDEKAEIISNELQSISNDCKTNTENNVGINTMGNVNSEDNVSQEQLNNVNKEENMKQSLVGPAIENYVHNSVNDSMRNITMNRGGCRRVLPAAEELMLDSDREDSLTRRRTEQTSVLETMAMIQQMGLNQTPAVRDDQSKLMESLPLKKDKGGKRSFEMALELENDTEESPVKQICLPDAIHSVEGDFLLNTSAPSFLMNSLNAPNITFPSLHQSEITSTSRVEKAIYNQSSATLNLGTNLECSLPKPEKRSADGIHFSLRLDVSTNCGQEISVEDYHDSMETSQTHVNRSYKNNHESVNVQGESIEKSSNSKDESHIESDSVLEPATSTISFGLESTEKQKDKNGCILKDCKVISQIQTHENNEEKDQSVNVQDKSIEFNLSHNSSDLEKSSISKDLSHSESDDVGSSASRSTIIQNDIMETSQIQTVDEKDQSTNIQDESAECNGKLNSHNNEMSSSFTSNSHTDTDVLETSSLKTAIDSVSEHRKDNESLVTNQIQVIEMYDEKEQSVIVHDESISLTFNVSDASGLKKCPSSKDEPYIETDVAPKSPGPRNTTGQKNTEMNKEMESCTLIDQFNFNPPNGVPMSHPSNRYTIGANLIEKCNYNSNESKQFVKQRAKSTLFIKPQQKIQNRTNVRGYSFYSQDPMDIIKKCKKIRQLEREVFVCDLIPKWIEMQFSVENGSITNPSYKLICPEKEKNLVGEYILSHIKFTRTQITDLVLELESPTDTFLTHLVKNLSLICKYHNGKMKGNVLTIEVVNCRRHFWAAVDVNLKYPKFLSPMEIIISKQTVGELKLSEVRQIFSSIEKGPDQLYNFAKELSKLRF